jgi:predicted phage terminase large subunit-like protein
MNEPIEREGQLYSPEELRRFFTMPDNEPDAIIAICDTKEQGNDYLAMPIFKQYGDDFYLDVWICDNGKVEVLEKRVARALKDNNVRLCRIESNRGGTLFAKEVREELKEIGGSTTITTKWTQSNKETRIQVNSGWVKEHILFRDDSVSNREYRTAMTQLYKYTMAGKNKHDDIPDVLSLFVDMVASSEANVATVVRRPF